MTKKWVWPPYNERMPVSVTVEVQESFVPRAKRDGRGEIERERESNPSYPGSRLPLAKHTSDLSMRGKDEYGPSLLLPWSGVQTPSGSNP